MTRVHASPMRNPSRTEIASGRTETVVLGALLRHQGERSLLTDWFGARPRLVLVDTRLEVLRVVRRMDVRVVVIPPFDGRGVPTAPLIERLLDERPGVGVVLVTPFPFPQDEGVALLAAVRAGACPLVAPTADALWSEIAVHLLSGRRSRTRLVAPDRR